VLVAPVVEEDGTEVTRRAAIHTILWCWPLAA
jgi:hypothetical protein